MRQSMEAKANENMEEVAQWMTQLMTNSAKQKESFEALKKGYRQEKEALQLELKAKTEELEAKAQSKQ